MSSVRVKFAASGSILPSLCGGRNAYVQNSSAGAEHTCVHDLAVQCRAVAKDSTSPSPRHVAHQQQYSPPHALFKFQARVGTSTRVRVRRDNISQNAFPQYIPEESKQSMQRSVPYPLPMRPPATITITITIPYMCTIRVLPYMPGLTWS